MGEVSIAVEARDAGGKSANRRLRAQGRAPAVVYAKGKDPVTLSVHSTQLERKLRDSETGMNTLFGLEGDARVSGRTVIVKELQRDPIHGGVIHADFFEIDMSQRLNVSVPIHLSGEAVGVSMGGVVEHHLREVELACLPGSIPAEVTIDVSALEVGDGLRISDLPLPGNVELITDETQSVVSVVVPRVVEEEPEPEDEELEEGAEPAEGEGAKSEEGDSKSAEESSD